jgi:hypothetical protein
MEWFNKKKKKNPLTAPPSIVFIELIARIGPYILVTGRVGHIVNIRPQITKGIILRVHLAPPVIVAAPGTVPVSGIPPAVPRRLFPDSSHLFSHPFPALLKINFIPAFSDK